MDRVTLIEQIFLVFSDSVLHLFCAPPREIHIAHTLQYIFTKLRTTVR